jgi:hypothetical protein
MGAIEDQPGSSRTASMRIGSATRCAGASGTPSAVPVSAAAKVNAKMSYLPVRAQSYALQSDLFGSL